MLSHIIQLRFTQQNTGNCFQIHLFKKAHLTLQQKLRNIEVKHNLVVQYVNSGQVQY